MTNSTELTIKGYVRNHCSRCGRNFNVPYFDDETPDDAKKNICFLCTFGFKSYEDYGRAVKEVRNSKHMEKKVEAGRAGKRGEK